MAKPKKHRQLSFSGKLGPRKPRNPDVRPREHLIVKEAALLVKAAGKTADTDIGTPL